MNISYEPHFSMEKFNNDIRIQNLVNICLDNNYGQVFDDIVGAIALPNENAVIDFFDKLEHKYRSAPNFQLFSKYRLIILSLFRDSQIKNLKGAFLEVLSFKILEKQHNPYIFCTDCNVIIDSWKSNLTVDIAMESDSSALCCECKVPTSKFTWNIFKNLLDIKNQSQNYFSVYAVTLSEQERMDSKKQRINRSVPESIGVIDEVHCITRENLINFS